MGCSAWLRQTNRTARVGVDAEKEEFALESAGVPTRLFLLGAILGSQIGP